MGWPFRDHEENEAIEEDRREKGRAQLSRDHITSEKGHDSIPNFPVLCVGARRPSSSLLHRLRILSRGSAVQWLENKVPK